MLRTWRRALCRRDFGFERCDGARKLGVIAVFGFEVFDLDAARAGAPRLFQRGKLGGKIGRGGGCPASATVMAPTACVDTSPPCVVTWISSR